MPLRRIPPESVLHELRREVGYGCPVAGCGSPYLKWHHFDPPWHEREHHEPQGMIALCGPHHDAADGGAYTVEQLKEMKQNGAARNGAVGGRFEWMRNKVLGVIGGNYYYECGIMLVVANQPTVWFNRDERGSLLLNLQMPTISGLPRAQIRDNVWLAVGAPTTLVCPPNGKSLKIKYANGDRLSIAYRELESAATFARRFGHEPMDAIPFPVTAVEISLNIAGSQIRFSPKGTTAGGGRAVHCLTARNAVGMTV
jgi:hypothetical protein